jgi:hypothetical protein
MNDRTAEIKELREFMADHTHGSKSLLHVIVQDLKAGTTMFDCLRDSRKALLLRLIKHKAIEFASRDKGELIWCQKHYGECQPCWTYRIKPDYELPDLTEVTPPRFATGTMVMSKAFGVIYEVIDRDLNPATKTRPGDWWAQRSIQTGQEGWDKSDYQELPPMPDKQKLADKGYKLTMGAADCRKANNGHLWVVDIDYSCKVADGDECYEGRYNGWRWLVEKVEPVKGWKYEYKTDSDGVYTRAVDAITGGFIANLYGLNNGKLETYGSAEALILRDGYTLQGLKFDTGGRVLINK